MALDDATRELRARFDEVSPLTVGLEEEVMLLHPETFDLVPVADRVLERLDGDLRFKPELPAAQLEIVTPPLPSAREALDALRAGRRDLLAAAEGLARPGAAAVHPFAAAEGELNRAERYERIRAEYASVARRQLVSSLQVHVAVGGADRTLAVYEGLRRVLPEIAALAANGPFHAGVDTGLASIRPKISETLPRQGVPPPIESWEAFAAALAWGARAGGVPEPRFWWWELRPHPTFGTLEMRVPDAQTTLADAAGVAAFVHALVATVAERHDGGERLEPAPTWRIEENRWSAARHGVEGTMADLATGEPEPTRDRLLRLIDEVEPAAARLGVADLLAESRRLVAVNGSMRQREVAASEGLRGVAAHLAGDFPPPDAPDRGFAGASSG